MNSSAFSNNRELQNNPSFDCIDKPDTQLPNITAGCKAGSHSSKPLEMLEFSVHWTYILGKT